MPSLKYYFNKKRYSNIFTCFLVLISFSKGYSQEYWNPIAESFGRYVYCFYVDPETNILYVGGDFNRINGEIRMGIAAYDGSNFYPLGCGVDWDCESTVCSGCFPRIVRSITKYNGELYVGGSFFFVDSLSAHGIARWNGFRWNSCNSDNQITIRELLVIDNYLYSVGIFSVIGNINANSIAKWDGTTWSDVGSFPSYDVNNPNSIFSIEVYKGEIYVGGIFQDSMGLPVNIMKFDGNVWSPVGGGTFGQQSIVYDLEVFNNELYVGGYFTKSNGNTGDYIQKWNGESWSEVGNGVWETNGDPAPVRKFYKLNNELWVMGDFDHAGNIPAKWIAKWDGAKWCSLPTELFQGPLATALSYNNQLIIGGTWFHTESDTIQGVAIWTGGNYVDTCSTVGISEVFSEKENLQIYPNPASSELNIKLSEVVSGEYTILLYDMQGKTIRVVTSKDPETVIDISQLPKGVYGVKVVGNGICFMDKVVKIE